MRCGPAAVTSINKEGKFMSYLRHPSLHLSVLVFLAFFGVGYRHVAQFFLIESKGSINSRPNVLFIQPQNNLPDYIH